MNTIIRTLIMAVVLGPIINLTLNWIKKDKMEDFSNFLYLSKKYQTVMHICALGFIGCGILLILVFGLEETTAHIIFIIICAILIEICTVMMKRTKVYLEEDGFCYIPFIGRKKHIKFNEISDVKLSEQIGAKIYIGNKKICTISCDFIGYEQFITLLKEETSVFDEKFTSEDQRD